MTPKSPPHPTSGASSYCLQNVFQICTFACLSTLLPVPAWICTQLCLGPPAASVIKPHSLPQFLSSSSHEISGLTAFAFLDSLSPLSTVTLKKLLPRYLGLRGSYSDSSLAKPSCSLICLVVHQHRSLLLCSFPYCLQQHSKAYLDQNLEGICLDLQVLITRNWTVNTWTVVKKEDG